MRSDIYIMHINVLNSKFILDFNQDDDKSEDEGDNDRTITSGLESKFT